MKKKIALALVVVGVLAAILIATRPAPVTSKDTTSHTRLPNPPSTRERAPLVSTVLGKQDAGLNVSSKDVHGPSDVVRSRDKIDNARRARPRFEPRWDTPTKLTFAALKRHYREFKEQGDFKEGTIRALSGAAIQLRGAVMPIDPVPESGEMKRFWLSNPVIVMAGCVFCRPPTLADIVYVTMPGGRPFEVDRERLYRGIVITEILGRLLLGPVEADGVDYLFGLELKERLK